MGRAFEYRRAAKEKRWDKMSKVFPKLSKAITVAAKEGGSDPEMNFKLRAAIQNAKAENMPKDNIDSAIKRASDKELKDYIEQTFEGKGPHGVLVIVETATDNNNRTVANIRSYFNKAGGNLGTSGSVEFMFTHFCNFGINQNNVDIEKIELEFIDFGVEEVFVDNDIINLYGADTARWFMLSDSPPERNLDWSNSGIEGSRKFIVKVWSFFNRLKFNENAINKNDSIIIA